MARHLHLSAMIIRIIFFSIALTIFSLFVVNNNKEAIFFESLESKTIDGNLVYNKIKLFEKKDHDIWMMNQSHIGPKPKTHQMDRLAIVIDKTKKPMVASYYQLNPGPLKWTEDIKVKPYKVSCFVCHANGLRVIRANSQSNEKPLNLFLQAKLKMWNFKIKSYGRVIASKQDLNSYKTHFPPFRWPQRHLNKKLNIKTCNYCHKNNGLFARGELTAQNSPTIKYLYENGFMPPFGIKLSSNEKKQIEQFLKSNL